MMEIARLAKSMKAKCPHCGHYLDMSGFALELFAMILNYFVEKKENRLLHVPRFGTFYTTTLRPTKYNLKYFKGVKGERRRLRYRAPQDVKDLIDGKPARKQEFGWFEVERKIK